MIIAKNISKSFGEKQAVHPISFEVDKGQNLALLGTSGSGKTTTLRMINRLVETETGSISINGKNSNTINQEVLRRNMGYVLQHNGLFPHYTVAQNIAIVPNLLGWKQQEIAYRASELMEQVQLSQSLLQQYPHALSGGEQQRVGLARALAANPDILLMDEPFGALDTVTRHIISHEFSKLEMLKNKTIVLVTHDVQEAFTLGDVIILMHNGSIMQQGTAAELLFKPANSFVQSFFEKNRLQLELQALRLPQILRFLEPADNADGNAVDAELNLWEILSQMDEHPGRAFYAHTQDGGKKLDQQRIFYVLEKFKTAMA